jgi:hypothetical protein
MEEVWLATIAMVVGGGALLSGLARSARASRAELARRRNRHEIVPPGFIAKVRRAAIEEFDALPDDKRERLADFLTEDIVRGVATSLERANLKRSVKRERCARRSPSGEPSVWKRVGIQHSDGSTFEVGVDPGSADSLGLFLACVRRDGGDRVRAIR